MVPGMKELPYKDRLQQLGLWTLEERRADLLEMFKTLIGKSSPKFESLFERIKYSISYKITQSNFVDWTFGNRKYFFCERVIDRWKGPIK